MPTIATCLPSQLPIIREFFTEYAKAIEVDLCFQDFDRELLELPRRYAPPEGRLFLALEHDQAAGCVALRQLATGICEMKRLYVRPAFRGRGLGRQLATAAITAAREIRYGCLRLDTLGSMREAFQLYESRGFQRIAPYCESPCAAARFTWN